MYHPTPLQIAYATAYLGAICDGSVLTDETLAGKIGCARESIVRWRGQQGFLDWLTGHCLGNRRGGMERLLNRALHLGIKGSVKHAEFYAKFSGEVAGLGPLVPKGNGEHDRTETPAGGFTINVLVPRPEPMPMSKEAGLERPKLPPPGSAPVVEGVVVQRLHIDHSDPGR